ncbi:MAG TPA: phytanoyl-CoA dioxygenase family protein [Acidimicrobiales bacterium]|nr:phytanoyl-CoA dioxygenase family protein [Acidimicrobiales bacterium]
MHELSAEEIAGHTTRVAEEGYTIIEDAFDPAFADDIRADLDRLERDLAVTPAQNVFEGTSTVRIYNLLVHGPLYEAIPVARNVLPVVEGVLDRGCLISSLSSIVICPGETAQPIHADDQLIPIPKPHPPTVCNTMWAITDFTEENGATRLIPGSHLRDSNPSFTSEYDTVAAEMRKGSVLVWHGSLWHGGGANRSGDRRYGIAMNYCAGYIRQQENQQLGVPPELVRRFEPRLQELVGYGIYNGLIGHIDKQSPLQLLGRTPEGGMIWDAARA